MHFMMNAVAAALIGAKGAEGTLHGGMLRRFEDGDKGLNAAAVRFRAVSELEFGHAAGSYSAGSSVEKTRVGRRLQGEGSEAAVIRWRRSLADTFEKSLVMGTYQNGPLRYAVWEETNSAYTEVTGASNPFNSIASGQHLHPSLVDLNGDGVLDLYIGAANSNRCYENQGTNTNPDFIQDVGFCAGLANVGKNPTTNSFVGGITVPVFVDLDADGDLDMVYYANDDFWHYENTGSPTAPTFVLRLRKQSANTYNNGNSPFSTVIPQERIKPTFVDLDGDGDLDFFLVYNYGIKYYKNVGTQFAPNFELSQDESPFVGWNLGGERGFSASFGDVDGDGDLDLLLRDGGNLKYYSNSGNSSNPIFSEVVETNNYGLDNNLFGAVNYLPAPVFLPSLLLSSKDDAADVGLDQDTFLDRNPGVKPRLDITGGANGTDEAAVEFWRAPLSRMYDDANTDSRIVVRFYGVNKADGKCDKTKLVGSWVSGGSDVPDENETYNLTGTDTPWMTGTIQDKMDINGTSVSDSGYASDDDGKTRIPMLLKINILKSLIGPANPLWHGETADSVSIGDFKVCANIQVERHLDTDATDGADTWVALLWRDFLVFLGVNLEDNVFTIGDETGEGIQVTIDAVENATSTYEKPELAFYQCIGQDNFNFDRRTPIDADVAQNGLVQMCLMPKSDDVYICEVDMEVDVNGIEETMQKVSKKELVAEGSDPAGTPDQSSIVSLYDRKYVNCTFGPNGCDVQKVDIQTLASQAGNFLNITGTVTYCFRNEGTSGDGGRRLEKVPFDLSTAQRLRSLQAGGADEGAGAEPFSVSLKIDKIAYDGDEVSDMYVEGDVTMNNGGDDLDTYSAAAGAPSGGFFKILSVVVGVSAVFLF